MGELITEILIFLVIAAVLGLLIGYLIWGWSRSSLISAARAEGAATARTSVDGATGLRQQLDACAEERATLERENDALQLRLDTLEAEKKAAAAAAADADAGAGGDGAGDDSALRAELAAAETARAAAEAEAARLQGELTALIEAPKEPDGERETSRDVEAELAAAGAVADELRGRNTELQARIDALEAAAGDAGSDKDIIDGLRQQHAEMVEAAGSMEAENAELKARLSALEAAAGDAGADKATIDGLREQLDACAGAREGLESENAALRAQIAQLEAAEAEPSPAAAADDAPVPAGPPPASLLTERPDEVDDLKEIKGVGPKMEGILNDKGVYLFRQVANFSPQDVAWVNEAIEAFPGRIERDAWVAQAQVLYRGKYGKAHDE